MSPFLLGLPGILKSVLKPCTTHDFSQAFLPPHLLHSAQELVLLWHVQAGQCNAGPLLSYRKDNSETRM